MKGAVWQALAAASVLAAVFVGTALAANSGSFGDPSGDAGPSPDITGVAISSDDAGMLTIKVTLANRGGLAASDEVTVGIDSDQNPDTGAVFYGAEFALDLVIGELREPGGRGRRGRPRGANLQVPQERLGFRIVFGLNQRFSFG